MSFVTYPTGFGALEAERTDLSTARVVVLPLPYDLTTSYVSGTRLGPAAIIEASRHLELCDEETGRDFSEVGIHTCDPLAADTRGPEYMVDAIQAAAARLHALGKFVLGLGGEHSVSNGLVRAAASRWPDLGVLQLDAHLDLRDSFEESPFNHACVMRRLRDDLGLPLVQVGIRSFSSEEHSYVQEQGLLPVSARLLATATREERSALLQDIVDRLPARVYLSVDLDVFDPSILPGTGTPEPGGLDWYAVVDLVAAVASRCEIVAADVVELAPIGGQVASDFLAAKLCYKIIGHALALRDPA
ncbi:MAG: agmatinase [Pseudomonadota bacterium]